MVFQNARQRLAVLAGEEDRPCAINIPSSHGRNGCAAGSAAQLGGHHRVLALFVLAGAVPANAVRLKDIASFSGMRNNELVGYGLVVGLAGTGDGTTSEFTIRSLTNMLEKMGVSVNPTNLKPKNSPQSWLRRVCRLRPGRARRWMSPFPPWATPRACLAACCC
jgi:hypothetical protein